MTNKSNGHGPRIVERFDAVIAGGGVAGSTTAAALARQGLRVLVCEAGLPDERRLAGELMHPAAVRDLTELGLVDHLRAQGSMPVYGFAVFRDPAASPTVLPYSEAHGDSGNQGMAIEHAVLTRTLLDTVAQRPLVTVWHPARVLSADPDGLIPTVTIQRGEEELIVGARLIVSAEGRTSKIRDGAGIGSQRGAAFRMLGWRIPRGRLPYPGFGHIFLGGRAPTLAYQIGAGDVRVMTEVGLDEQFDANEMLSHIPAPFREDVAAVVSTRPAQSAKVFALSPGHVAAGRLAVVGDAGGCVHPLTATGISFCTRDATRLAGEVSRAVDQGMGIEQALTRYDAGRRDAMRTRSVLGSALADVLSANTPETRLLRDGVFRYWSRSPRGRRVTMGLLSTQETRPRVFATEYALVALHALPSLWNGAFSPDERRDALSGIARRSVDYLRDTFARN